MNKPKDRTGERYGRLVLLSCVGTDENKEARWECVCDCGNTVIVRIQSLRCGNTKSCGCFHREVVSNICRKTVPGLKHGMSYRPEYRAWQSMKDRCLNSNHPKYKDWGGRGIKVCERWLHSFENFYQDMGDRPQDTTLDRINNDGNYEPTNCRWASWIVQENNKRRKLRKVLGDPCF